MPIDPSLWVSFLPPAKGNSCIFRIRNAPCSCLYVPSCRGLGRRSHPPVPDLHARPAKPPGGQAQASTQALGCGRVPCLALPSSFPAKKAGGPKTKPHLWCRQASRRCMCVSKACLCVLAPPQHTARHYTHAHAQSKSYHRRNKAFRLAFWRGPLRRLCFKPLLLLLSLLACSPYALPCQEQIRRERQ